MKRAVLILSILLLFCQAAFCQDEQPAEDRVVRGLIGVLDTKPPIFQYATVSGKVVQTAERIKGAKDLRPWKKRHPGGWRTLCKIRFGCTFSAPILTAGGAICQILSYLHQLNLL